MDRSLANIDLNLLRALLVLIEERSVTRAAERLFISQPAMSKSLHRLRELLDDPLFLRSPKGLLVTPRAEALSAPLRATFEQLERYLIPSRFDPASVGGCLRIAAPEQFALGTVPQLLKCLREKAPNLGVELLHLNDDYLEKLATGKLDFAINLDQPYPEHFVAHPIFTAAAMVWFRKKHPLVQKRKINLVDICSYPQIMFHAQNLTAQNFRVIEQSRFEAGLDRKVLLDTNHLLIAIDTLMNTDAVMVAPEYLFRPPISGGDIIQRPIGHIPVLERLQINLSLLQHSRTLNSPLHQWIIGEMRVIFAAGTGRKKQGETVTRPQQKNRKTVAKKRAS